MTKLRKLFGRSRSVDYFASGNILNAPDDCNNPEGLAMTSLFSHLLQEAESSTVIGYKKGCHRCFGDKLPKFRSRGLQRFRKDGQ